MALNRVLKIVLIFIHALNFSSNLGKSSQQVIACELTFSLAKLLRVFQSGKGKIILWSTSCYENCRYMSASASLIYRIRLSVIKWIITQWFSASKLFFVSICFQHFERKAKEDVDFFFFLLIIQVQPRRTEQLSPGHCDGNAKTTTASCPICTPTTRRIWGIWWHISASRLSLIFSLV